MSCGGNRRERTFQLSLQVSRSPVGSRTLAQAVCAPGHRDVTPSNFTVAARELHFFWVDVHMTSGGNHPPPDGKTEYEKALLDTAAAIVAADAQRSEARATELSELQKQLNNAEKRALEAEKETLNARNKTAENKAKYTQLREDAWLRTVRFVVLVVAVAVVLLYRFDRVIELLNSPKTGAQPVSSTPAGMATAAPGTQSPSSPKSP